MSNEQIVALVVALMPLITMLAGVGYRYLISRLPESQRATTERIVASAVRSVEQFAADQLTGPEKRARALELIHSLLPNADPQLVEMLLEEAVYLLPKNRAA